MALNQTDLASFQVNPDLVREIATKTIEAHVARAIGSPEELIKATVSRALSIKVDKDGKVSQYSSENKFDYLEVLSGNLLREKATESLREFLSEKSDEIKAAVISEMKKPSNARKIAQAVVDMTAESLKANWRFNCEIVFDKKD